MFKRIGFVIALVVCAAVFFLAGQKYQQQSQPNTNQNTAIGTTPTGTDSTSGSDGGNYQDTDTAGASAASAGGSDSQGEVEQSEPVPPVLSYPQPPKNVREATVRHISDGDSFDIVFSDNGKKAEVRLLAINAPEKGDCYANAATKLLKNLVDNKPILVEETDYDRYGRLLGNVWTYDGSLLNVRLVADGAAFARTSKSEYFGLTLEALELAKRESNGMWNRATCLSPWSDKVAIDSVFADAPGPDDQNLNGEYVVLANISDEALDLHGWYVRDESTTNRHHFKNTMLEPGAYLIVRSGCGTDTTEEQFWCAEVPVWNNNGDSAFLVDADGLIAATLTYQR